MNWVPWKSSWASFIVLLTILVGLLTILFILFIDPRFYRCTYDWDQTNYHYVKNNTKCVKKYAKTALRTFMYLLNITHFAFGFYKRIHLEHFAPYVTFVRPLVTHMHIILKIIIEILWICTFKVKNVSDTRKNKTFHFVPSRYFVSGWDTCESR